MKVVVDTNVPKVANGQSVQASPECVFSCAQRIQRITSDSDRLVLDDQWRIVREYRANLRSEGQPGLGDAFLRWVLTNLANPTRCELVTVTPIDDSNTEFQEFPTDTDLKTFDPNDRKFVAVAIAHPQKPHILQAVDNKWRTFSTALKRHGVTVDFLCSVNTKQSNTSRDLSRQPVKVRRR